MSEIINEIIENLKTNNSIDQKTLELLKRVDAKLDLAQKIEKCLYDSELYLVYKHTDPLGKVYIGITQNHPQTRWNDGGGYDKQTKFYKAIQRYGWINFKHEILAAGLTKKEALEYENEMIIMYESYKDEYGYNTKVDFKETDVKKKVSLVKKDNETKVAVKSEASKDITKIAQELVEIHAIKTLGNQIYYLNNGEYVLERERPFLEKELIIKYNIPTKLHKEVIKQIKILSHTLVEKKNKISVKTDVEKVEEWMLRNNFDIGYLLGTPTTAIYNDYKLWCVRTGFQDVLGKKHFFKTLCDMFVLIKMQKSDGKRYFCSKANYNN